MSLFDQRREERYQLNSKIEYVIDAFSSNEFIEGVIENISKIGFCMITAWPLSKSQEIIIKDCSIFLPSQYATVCWLEPYKDGCYRVGLEFSLY